MARQIILPDYPNGSFTLFLFTLFLLSDDSILWNIWISGVFFEWQESAGINPILNRAKIKAGFKEIKQEIDSLKAQTRNHHPITNPLNFCVMAATVTWIYADHLDKTPQRCYAVNNRSHFAFSGIRKLTTQAALNQDFVSFCPKLDKLIQNFFIDALLRRVA